MSKVEGINVSTAYFKAQHKELAFLIKKHAVLGDLIFQGEPLKWHASEEGLNKLLEAVNNSWLDPIALNHSIKRYRIKNYASDLVWDYPGIDMGITFDDPLISELSKNFLDIKEEILNIIDLVRKFPDSDDLTNKMGSWNYIPFFDKNGTPVKTTITRCPKISSLLTCQNVNTELGFTFVSVLAGNSTIAAHKGSTALRKRYHLPIEVPSAGESKIRIGSEWVTWHAGKAFSFYDALEHEVIHNSEKQRILFIIDVWSDALPEELIKVIKHNKNILGYATENKGSVAIND